MAWFRLLHLSDFHLAVRQRQVAKPDWPVARPSPDTLYVYRYCSSHDQSLATAVARWVYQEGERFDVLLITGDLATTGDDDDLDVACRMVLAAAGGPDPWLAPDGMPTLAASKVPVFLLPGNHDRYEGLLKRAGGTRFFGYFSEKYWPSTARVRAYPLLELDGERLAVVGADLCLTNTLLDAGWRRGGKWAWLGQGRAHPAVLRAMVDETTRVRRERGPVAVVWAVHFPPRFHGLDGDLVLLQEDDLLEAAREAEVNHLFCGHTHQARSYPAGAGLDVYCAGTATQYVAPWGNTLHPIDIEVTGGQVRAVSWQTVTWNEDLGDFV